MREQSHIASFAAVTGIPIHDAVEVLKDAGWERRVFTFGRWIRKGHPGAEAFVFKEWKGIGVGAYTRDEFSEAHKTGSWLIEMPDGASAVVDGKVCPGSAEIKRSDARVFNAWLVTRKGADQGLINLWSA